MTHMMTVSLHIEKIVYGLEVCMTMIVVVVTEALTITIIAADM